MEGSHDRVMIFVLYFFKNSQALVNFMNDKTHLTISDYDDYFFRLIDMTIGGSADHRWQSPPSRECLEWISSNVFNTLTRVEIGPAINPNTALAIAGACAKALDDNKGLWSMLLRGFGAMLVEAGRFSSIPHYNTIDLDDGFTMRMVMSPVNFVHHFDESRQEESQMAQHCIGNSCDTELPTQEASIHVSRTMIRG